MQKKCKKRILVLAMVLIFILAACGSPAEDEPADTDAVLPDGQTAVSQDHGTENEYFGNHDQGSENPAQQAEFGGVPWFQDDAGKNTQLNDGFLYAYWGSRLCRYDPETLEETVLYEASSVQSGDFCVYGGYVYFLVRRDVTFLDGPVAALYRVSCDGTELAELKELQIGDGYELDVYEDVLYLIYEYRFYDGENIYLRIKDDGVEQIPESETLYGMLPEGYVADRHVYQYSDMPSLPYMMRNFGYMFLWDADEKLFRYDPASGILGRFELPGEAEGMTLYLTNDSILFVDKEGSWNRISLDDPTEIAMIHASCFEKGGELYRMPYRCADESGLYFVEIRTGYVDQIRYAVLTKVSWEGEYECLYRRLESHDLTTSLSLDEEVRLIYFAGDHFYYNDVARGDGVILRVPLKRDESVSEWELEPEQVAVYYESPYKDISQKEKVVTEFHAEGLSGSFTVEEVYLTDGSGASGKINQSLEKIYTQWQEQIQEYEQLIRERGNEGSGNEDLYSWDYTLVTSDYGSYIHYLDQDYIGFTFGWMEYWGGAAHYIYGSRYMVFDRNTGRQVSLEEFTGLSGEKLCRIIAPYVDAAAEFSEKMRPGEESILDDWRFFLSKEGIGIHYDVYEISSFAGGDRNIIVPYEAFAE